MAPPSGRQYDDGVSEENVVSQLVGGTLVVRIRNRKFDYEEGELVIDAVVPPGDLRDEIAARLKAARGRRDPLPAKRRSVTPL